MSKGGKLIVFSAPSGSENNDSQTSIKPRRFELRILHFSSLANQEVKKQMEKIITSFQLKNSNNTSRMTTFWNGKKFTETISTELKKAK
jgi:hypothetical protein